MWRRVYHEKARCSNDMLMIVGLDELFDSARSKSEFVAGDRNGNLQFKALFGAAPGGSGSSAWHCSNTVARAVSKTETENELKRG